MAEIHMEEWLKAVAELSDGAPPSKDWITRHQFAAMMGLRGSRAKEILKALIKAGKCETAMYDTKREDGQRIAVPHYRLK